MVDPTRLRALIADPEGPCVTVMLPTARTGREVWQGPIRFKNLVRELERQLSLLDGDDDAGRAVVESLTRDVESNGFWENQREGLILLAAPGVRETWRVPFTVPEYAHVGARFHLKRAIEVASSPVFELLSFSRGSVRLFRADASHVEPVTVAGLPPDLDTFLGLDVREAQLQHNTARGAEAQARPGGAQHGHSVGHDGRTDELQRFATAVARAVEVHRRSFPRAPALVLAASQREAAAYRATTQDPDMLPEGLEGNFDHARPEDLRRRAWELVAARWHAELERDLALVREGVGSGSGSTNLRAVLGAAHQGRVRAMFVAGDGEHWGRFTPADGKLETTDGPGPGFDALLDQAACMAYLNGAKVHIVPAHQVPGGNGIAAAFFEHT
jgi:hypothetical protein